MSVITRFGGNHRMSNVVQHNGTLYLAGQVPDNTDVGVALQTKEVLTKVDSILAEHRSGKERILFCQIFLADMRLFKEMNEVWDAWVPQSHAPARATVEARLASPGKLIEICVTAAISEDANLSF